MTNKVPACPECEASALAQATRNMDIQVEGRSISVSGLECYRCQNCDTEVVAPDQIRRNQLRIADHKREAMGMLRGDQIRSLRESLGLSQPDAARLFGGGPNAFSKYERGEVLQSIPMDRILKLVAAYPFVLGFLQNEAGLNVSVDGYTDMGRVSLNDPLFRSRTLTTNEVVVSISDWKKKVA